MGVSTAGGLFTMLPHLLSRGLYRIAPPPRRAVLPLPNTSSAKPSRGPQRTPSLFTNPVGTFLSPDVTPPGAGLPTPGTNSPTYAPGNSAPVSGFCANFTPFCVTGAYSGGDCPGTYKLRMKTACSPSRFGCISPAHVQRTP